MGRLVLAVLAALSLLSLALIPPALAHGAAGGCPAHAMGPEAHGGGEVHHPHRHDPAPKGGAVMIACCLAVSAADPAGASFRVEPRPERVAASGLVDAFVRGRIVEPAERPPRLPFLPSA